MADLIYYSLDEFFYKMQVNTTITIPLVNRAYIELDIRFILTLIAVILVISSIALLFRRIVKCLITILH